MFQNSPMYQACKGWCVKQRRVILTAAGVALGVLVLVLGGLGIWNTFYRTHEVAAQLDSRHWERELEIEEYRVVEDSSWSRPPSDAYDKRSRTEIHHYERRQVGTRQISYSCGTSQTPRTCYRSEPIYQDFPVYATKYYFKVNRWKTADWMKTTGEDQAPAWAKPVGMNTAANLGNRRIGDGRKEKYWYHLSCDECDKGQKVGLHFEEWDRLREGQIVTAHVNSRGTIRGIDVV